MVITTNRRAYGLHPGIAVTEAKPNGEMPFRSKLSAIAIFLFSNANHTIAPPIPQCTSDYRGSSERFPGGMKIGDCLFFDRTADAWLRGAGYF